MGEGEVENPQRAPELDRQLRGYVRALVSDRDTAARAAAGARSEVFQARMEGEATALRLALSYLHSWTGGEYGIPLADQEGVSDVG